MPSHSTISDWSPTVQVNITNLIDNVQCYQTVRELRWPNCVFHGCLPPSPWEGCHPVHVTNMAKASFTPVRK